MTTPQLTIALILGVTFALLVWGRFRYDIVAAGALCLAVVAGLVPADGAFRGFGHPATVTVAAVLILSRGLTIAGVIDLIAHRVVPQSERIVLRIGGLGGFAAGLSAIINNVGALALLMPLAIQSSIKIKQSPALILMPLAFASILGGLITLIGTPPNIIIAAFRENYAAEPFGMFDFSPVGGAVAIAGLIFVSVVGWRLLPKDTRDRSITEDLFDISGYVTEGRVLKTSPVNGQTLGELDDAATKHDVMILGVRRGQRPLRLAHYEKLKTNDRILIEGNPQGIDKIVTDLGLKISGTSKDKPSPFGQDGGALVEAVVESRSRIIGRTLASLRLPSRQGINLLAVARQGQSVRGRLTDFRFRAGDVILLQGDKDLLSDGMASLGCLPLAARDLQFGQSHKAWLAMAIFIGAVAAAAFGLVGLPIAFAMAVIAFVVSGILPVRDLYDGVDWPVIVLLGAMIPIGNALTTTGMTDLIADSIVDVATGLPVLVILTLVLVVTMTLSDILNNAATAVIMAPIGIGIAQRLDSNPDAFLMSVAVGASCAFLTPIGHQNNTLVMGPGGYAFGDYWRMGLPLEVVVVVVAVPMIALVWGV